MAPSRNYTDLIAWQKSMNLTVSVYQATNVMPREEQFGLTSQMRRAAVSIPSNIAEGQGRASDPAFLNHLSIAHGSLRELETQLMLAERLEFLSLTSVRNVLNEASEVGRLINGLANSIEARS
jgi:four helix bundle protein